MRNLQTICVIFAAFILFSCDDKSELEKPTPKIEFMVDHELIGVHWNVKLTNISDSSTIEYFEWDFGDGSDPETIFPEPNSSDIPRHSYSTPGEYTIKLTGVQEDGTRISNEQKIRVGEPFLDKVEILRMNEYRLNDSSEKWDNESEEPDAFPDVKLFIKKNGEMVYESATYSNLKSEYLPLDIEIPFVKIKVWADGFAMWGEQQQFYLYDIDGEEKELMITPEICSVLVLSNLGKSYEDCSGEFEVSCCGNFLLHFHYVIKLE